MYNTVRWFLKLHIDHTVLLRDWNPKIKILNTKIIIFSLCKADFVFSCQKIQKVLLGAKCFSPKIGICWWQKFLNFMLIQKISTKKIIPKKYFSLKNPAQSLEKIVFFLTFSVIFFWIISPVWNQHKIRDFFTPRLTCYEKKKIGLRMGLYVFFYTKKQYLQ
jgi:hypothetical protein